MRGYLSLLAFAVLLAAQPFLNRVTGPFTVPLILTLQRSIPSYSFVFWHNLSDLLDSAAQWGPCIFYLAQPTERARAFYYLMLTTAVFSLVNLLKMSEHQPRPFWIDPDI
jgi:hypothetical protein